MITEQQAKDEIAQVMAGMPHKSQKRVVKKLISKYRHELRDLDIVDTQRQKTYAIRQLDALMVLRAWSDLGGFVLEKNQCSRLHKMLEAMKNGEILVSSGEKFEPSILECQHTFVVKHDWSMALGGIDGDEFRLPYELCAFEFRISGRTVVSIAVEDNSRPEGMSFTVLVECNGFWFPLVDDIPKGMDKLSEFVWMQIKSICVALDAEVAYDDVIRVPHKLNAKRVKAGKIPIADFHVVDLAKRHRISNPSAGESGHKVRLHFRRGHWRHYEGCKTWIKWCLVGDPDLGFIAKHYSI